MKPNDTYRHKERGNYYSISEVTQTEVHIFPCGGGFVRKVPVEKFKAEYEASELPTELQAGKVILDGLDEPVVGWYSPHNLWNGWLIAYVSLEDCLNIIEVDKSMLKPTDYGYRIDHPEWGEIDLSQCTVEGLQNFYYIDGYCWEEDED